MNRAFRRIAEPILYHAVEVTSDEDVFKVYNAVTSNARLALLIRVFRARDVDGLDERVAITLSALIQALQGLESLTLNRFHLHGLFGGMLVLEALTQLNSPRLREFETGLTIRPTILMRAFAAHPGLEHVDISRGYIVDEPSVIVSLPIHLRSFACASGDLQYMLTSALPLSATLSRLHVRNYDYNTLTCTGKLLGTHLVSLRLSTSAGVRFQHSSISQPWMLDEIAREFPRLRFLQVDMGYVRMLLMFELDVTLTCTSCLFRANCLS